MAGVGHLLARWGRDGGAAVKRLSPLLTLALLACPTEQPKPDAGEPPDLTCETREQCDAGLICTQDKLCGQCTTSGQCSVKEVCDPDSLLCVLREGWGNECTTNENCQAGSWCRQGLCLARSQVSLCPGTQTTECPDENRCNQTTLVCEEDLGCASDFDCSAGEACNTGSRICQPRCTVDTQVDICPVSTRCIGELCRQCAEDSECGPGLVCDAAGNCSAGSRCYSDRDCPVPLVCLVQTGACLARAPACRSDDNCAASQKCDLSNGRCIPRNCQPDVFEPNNDDATATAVTPQTYRELTLCEADVDWFSIPLARGDQLGINLEADAFAENNFSTVIKDATGRTVSAGRFTASYVAPTAATYFVVVSTIDDFQPYGLRILKSRGTPCDDDAREPNDALAAATQLAGAGETDGRICPQDQDWFRISLPSEATTARVSLVNYQASAGRLRLCAFRDDGTTQISCNSDTLPVISTPVSVLGGPSIVVRVVGDTERIANSYTLKLELP